ncbi:DUF3040 domain-containing protein [Arthrobacter alpinus]|nr:DUF3040 domain-containing protein [Arthrobacter alpinus]
MALSERESRILLAVEKELAASDPHLSKSFDILASSGPAIRHLLWGTAVLAVGIGALVYAIAVHSALIGAAAFMAMTEGAHLALPRPRLFRTIRLYRARQLDSHNIPDE